MRVVTTALRKAKPAPRRTMPRAAIISGTDRASVVGAYASGNDVHGTTKMKINQTWLASSAGPIERGQLGSMLVHAAATVAPMLCGSCPGAAGTRGHAARRRGRGGTGPA